MSTKSLIDEVEPWAPGWSRATGNKSLLKLAQKGLDFMFGDADNPYFIWRGTDNDGFPPYLTTVDETQRYLIKASNLENVDSLTIPIAGTDYAVRANKILKVFVDATLSGYDYDKRWIGEPYAYNFYNPYSSDISRTSISNVACKKMMAYQNSDPYIDFPENPGDTTDIYFVEFTYQAIRLTAETVPLSCPERFEEGLIDFMIGTVQKRQNGKMNEYLANFYGDPETGEGGWISKFQNAVSTSIEEDDFSTPAIPC